MRTIARGDKHELLHASYTLMVCLCLCLGVVLLSAARSMFVDVFVQASGGNKWHRWYFVMFYIIGVLVILNVSTEYW